MLSQFFKTTHVHVKTFISDLFRRVCDKSEKDFLREKGVVSETQSDLGKKHQVLFVIFITHISHIHVGEKKKYHISSRHYVD